MNFLPDEPIEAKNKKEVTFITICLVVGSGKDALKYLALVRPPWIGFRSLAQRPCNCGVGEILELSWQVIPTITTNTIFLLIKG